MIIGVLSDTHGVLNEGAVDALRGVDRILHAGDIDRPEVITALERIAPVNAVRGNMDHGAWAQKLPVFDLVDVKGTHMYLLHDLNMLDLDPIAAGVHMIIYGHTHQADIQTRQGVLYFNPGSASYGRHGGASSVGRIDVGADHLRPKIIWLED